MSKTRETVSKDRGGDGLSDQAWERDVETASAARQHKIQKLRIAESGSGEYDDERRRHPFVAFLGWMGLIGLLTLGGAAAGWYFWLRHVEPDKQTVSQQIPPPQPVRVKPQTETYSSMAFLLQFDYPDTWKVVETDSNKLTVTSVPMDMKAVADDGKSRTVKARAVITMQHKQPSLQEFSAGDAVAVRESERMEYAKPSQMQRAATYISFLNLAASKSQGRSGIDGVYVSGDNGYTEGQFVDQTGLVNADPLIVVSFLSCNDTKCEKTGPALTLSADGWQDKKLSKPLRDVLESIVVQ